MKYFFIAGEPSGDLHARHLMDAIKQKDAKAEISYWYRPELAYMGFVSVAMHLPEILRGMKECKESIKEFSPDRLILVDYPGFNLKIAAWFHNTFAKETKNSVTPTPQVIYYIPPKIWAWKEGRIAQIRKYVDKVLSILPFEVQWYAERYDHHVDYVGNPTLDEIDTFRKQLQPQETENWKRKLNLGEEKIVALMPGSRRQEIELNLPMMLRAAMKADKGIHYVVASAPNMTTEFYNDIIDRTLSKTDKQFKSRITLAPCQGSKSSFMLLHCAHAALVTSGTATLETAIMGVPQAVCYAMRWGKIVSWLKTFILKVPYVSLVNLISGMETVPELIAGELTQKELDKTLKRILSNDTYRQEQQLGYKNMMQILGTPGAPEKAADIITTE